MKYALFLFLSIFALACSQESNDQSSKYLPPSSGTHNELLIVCHDSLWSQLAGRALVDVFGQEQKGLPQSEGTFSVNRISTRDFSTIFKKAKSIVMAEFSDSTYVSIRQNVWARPQVVITISAPDEKDMYLLIKKQQQEMVTTFYESDLKVVRGRMKGSTYKILPENLTNDLGIKQMVLNEGFNQTLDKPDLKIFRQQTKKTEQFLIFSKRRVAEEDIPGQDIIAARDSIGKNYFEGYRDGSYFTTETVIPPEQNPTVIDGRFAIETRGLWKTVGDFMGGPFISYTIYNDNTNEVITIEGLLFGPDAKKRNIILEMEAMITSVTFK
jgi:hypothetical protein